MGARIYYIRVSVEKSNGFNPLNPRREVEEIEGLDMYCWRMVGNPQWHYIQSLRVQFYNLYKYVDVLLLSHLSEEWILVRKF